MIPGVAVLLVSFRAMVMLVMVFLSFQCCWWSLYTLRVRTHSSFFVLSSHQFAASDLRLYHEPGGKAKHGT